MKEFACSPALLASPVLAQTRADMNRQTGPAYAQMDVAMMAQWTRAYAYMNGRDAQDGSRGGGFGNDSVALASQLALRDAQCVIQGGEIGGGSAQGMVQGRCKARLARERTQQLKALVWK